MSSLTPLSTFKDQFTFTPEVHFENTPKYNAYIVCGMGGSAICVNILKMMFPELPLTLHNSYGIPASFPQNTLFILNSYSGNTEEILESFDRVSKQNLPNAVVSKGGILIDLANKFSVPHIILPESNLEPRFSIGHQMIALLTLMGENEKIERLRNAIEFVDMTKCENEGKRLSEMFVYHYPVLYASPLLYPVAYLIKAALNEGAKVPAFVHIIPEANHNELQSFTTNEEKNEREHFGFIAYQSTYDHQRIIKRFSIMKDIFASRGFIFDIVEKDSTNITHVFELIISGYYFSTYLALEKNIDPYKTPLIQEFKAKLS